MSCQPDETSRSRSLSSESPTSLRIEALRIAHDQANHAMSLWHVTPGAVVGARLSHWEWPRPEFVPWPAPQPLVTVFGAAGNVDHALDPATAYDACDDLGTDCGTLSMLLGWGDLFVVNAEGSPSECSKGGAERHEPDGKDPT